MLKRFDHLHSLDLSEMSTEKNVWEPLGHLIALEEMSLSGRRASGEWTDAQFSPLKKLSRLKHLTFGEPQLSEERLRDIGALTSLESLSLYDCAENLTDNTLQPLRNLKNLEKLYIHGPTRISVEGLNGLVRAIPYLRDARIVPD
jgi:hypothetical protein